MESLAEVHRSPDDGSPLGQHEHSRDVGRDQGQRPCCPVQARQRLVEVTGSAEECSQLLQRNVTSGSVNATSVCFPRSSLEVEPIWDIVNETYGCTLETAINYDSMATLTHACVLRFVGCVDSTARNFAPDANVAGSCVPDIFGCMSGILFRTLCLSCPSVPGMLEASSVPDCARFLSQAASRCQL